MFFFGRRSWQIVTLLERLAGYWPYQNKFINYLLRSWSFIVLFVGLLALMLRLFKEIGVNIYIVLENDMYINIVIIGLAKLVTASAYQKERQKIFELVKAHHEFTNNTEERKALIDYSEYGLRFAIRYTLGALIICLVADSMLNMSDYYEYYKGRDEIEKRLPAYTDYLVDEDKYFNYILYHLMLCDVAILIMDSSYDLTFIMHIEHVCALFQIVRLRLGGAKEFLSDSNTYTQSWIDIDRQVYESLRKSIVAHNEALNMARLLEKIYRLNWLIVLLVNMASFGTALVLLLFAVKNFFEIIRYIVTFVLLLAHFYVIYSRGQKVMDHSLAIFDACHDIPVYKLSMKNRKLLSIMMMHSITPYVLTGGGIFTLSIETYAKMLKTGLSFFSVIVNFTQ